MLTTLLENKLYVKAKICEFHAKSVSFLGFVIQGGNLKTELEKVRAVEQWPVPDTSMNFNQWFIQDYRKNAAPLTKLTSSGKFSHSVQVDKAFNKLKEQFTTAAVLVQPDMGKQFIVEVDASDIGVGVVLSQNAGPENHLHPCAFFSCRLSPTECIYDVGNQVLLVIKLVLVEWRHWLERAEQ